MNITTIENNLFLIRPVIPKDEKPFMRIQEENSEWPKVYEEEHFRDDFWKNCLKAEEDIYMVIFLKENDQHIGNCSFQNVNSQIIDIGIDIDKTMQNKGLGTDVLALLVEYLKSHASGRRYRIKTRSDNMPCQKMIEKAGGVKTGEEATEFDRILDNMIPTLESYGMTAQVNEVRKMFNRNNGICSFIYEFLKES